MLNVIAVVAGVYAALVGALYLIQRELIYHPGLTMRSPAASGMPEMRPVEMTAADGIGLVSWYSPAHAGKPTIVYFQGNAGNIGDRGYKARPYLDRGFGLLLAGYRGYGDNPGEPTEDGLYADGRAQLAWLAGQGVGPRDWVLYGESLGSGVAVQLAMEQATKTPVAAVVLESPYTSMGDAAAAHYPFVPARTLVRDRFESLAKIARIGAPLLIVHGERDGVVPIAQGRRLFEAARPPKDGHWIAAGGHNDLYDHGAAAAVTGFLDRMVNRAK